MTAHNAAKSYNMRHAFSSDGEIVYSKVLISMGQLVAPVNANIVKSDTGFWASWKDDTDHKTAFYDDRLIFLAYDVQNERAFGTRIGPARSEKEGGIVIPESERGNTYHIWLAFVSDQRDKISNSSYMGSFEF